MSEFKELIKSFSKSREYVRSFFIYGFKTREDFTKWSGRTYDNERRRLESWLSGYVRQDYNKKRKNIYLSIDSRLLDTNPLYRVWKAKSFTDNDIMLHFYILDALQKYGRQTADQLTDGIMQHYNRMFDSQIVRRKCNQYAEEGMLGKEKRGRDIFYRSGPPFQKLLSAYPGLAHALKLYQLFSPLGIIGNTIMENVSLQNHCFRVRHNFFVHTLEDEILLPILQAMHQKRNVLLHIRSTKSENIFEKEGTPLKIFTSTRTGRRFLCLYLPEKRYFTTVRLDAVEKVVIKELFPDYASVRNNLEKNKAYAWGISFRNNNHTHLVHVKLTLYIDEHSEMFILNRLDREGKGGAIRRIAPDTFMYEIDVFDANEMLPWLRTFTGRIIAVESDSKKLNQLFKRDFLTMYHLYFKEGNGQ